MYVYIYIFILIFRRLRWHTTALYSSVASSAPRVDLFDPCDFLEKCLLSFSQIFSASLHSEISEIGDWETRPSCHFRVHMSTTVITNYHALVPPKKCPGAYSTRWKPAHLSAPGFGVPSYRESLYIIVAAGHQSA